MSLSAGCASYLYCPTIDIYKSFYSGFEGQGQSPGVIINIDTISLKHSLYNITEHYKIFLIF